MKEASIMLLIFGVLLPAIYTTNRHNCIFTTRKEQFSSFDNTRCGISTIVECKKCKKVAAVYHKAYMRRSSELIYENMFTDIKEARETINTVYTFKNL